MPNIIELPGPNTTLQPNEQAANVAREKGYVENRFARESGQALGRGVSAALRPLGEKLDKMVDDAERHETFAQISHASSVYASLFGDTMEKWRNVASESDPNDTSIMQGFKEHVLEPSLENFLKSSEALRPEAQRWTLSRADTFREQMTHTMIADMGTRQYAAVHKNKYDLESSWSKTVALNPEKLPFAIDTIKNDFEEQIRHAPYLKPGDAERIRAEVVTDTIRKVARAAAFGMARSNPEALATSIAEGKFDALDAEDQARATNLARESILHKHTNDEYENRLKVRGQLEQATAAKDEYVTAALNGKRMGDYANDPRLIPHPEMKENLRTLQHTLTVQARDKSESTPHPVEWRKVIDQLHETAENDPNNISDKPIYDLLRKGLLNKAEFGSALAIYKSIDNLLEKQINVYIKRADDFILKSVEGNIMKSVDAAGYADAINRFELDGRAKIAAARKTTQDITPLIDPNSKDFVFSAQRLASLLPGGKETIKKGAATVRAAAAAPAAPAPEVFESYITHTQSRAGGGYYSISAPPKSPLRSLADQHFATKDEAIKAMRTLYGMKEGETLFPPKPQAPEPPPKPAGRLAGKTFKFDAEGNLIQ